MKQDIYRAIEVRYAEIGQIIAAYIERERAGMTEEQVKVFDAEAHRCLKEIEERTKYLDFWILHLLKTREGII